MPTGPWPTRAGGTPDPKICGILTTDDFKAVGMLTGPPEATDFAPENKNKVIGVACNYGISHAVLDGVNFAVLPTPDAATALVRQVAGATTATTVQVTGADRSIFGPPPGAGYQLLATRGRLLVWVTMSPTVNSLTQDQARTAGIAIAEQVLSRAPDLGR